MSCTNVRFALCLMLICLTAAVVPASAQHFQQIPGSLTYIAAGRSEVWGLLDVFGFNSQVYRFNPGTRIFVQIPGALAGIAVGGGTLLQPDEVWGTNASGGVYRFNFNTNTFANVPGPAIYGIQVGEGDVDNCHPYEVWGTNSSAGNIVYRYNYCTNQFDQIQTPRTFSQVAVGANLVWGLDDYGCLYWWNVGAADWIEAVIGGHGSTSPACSFNQVTVGVNSAWMITPRKYMLWDWNNVNDATLGTYVGVEQFVDTGMQVNRIAAGGDGVWFIAFQGAGTSSFTSTIYRVDDNRWPTSYALASNAVQIAVGSGAGVWALDSFNRVYAFVRP